MKKLLLLSVSVLFISCDKYTISGTATGIKDGQTVILETQDFTGMRIISVDTVKIKDGKFEMKGKVKEISFHMLQVQELGRVPLILESGTIKVELNKDTIQKSKVYGTYNNDEYKKFNEEMTLIKKDITRFQADNMSVMEEAQTKKDTATINRLMREYSKLSENMMLKTKEKYVDYAGTHPKSFISVLIIDGLLQDPSADEKKMQEMYDGLDKSLKETRTGKGIKMKLAMKKMPSVNSGAPTNQGAPTNNEKPKEAAKAK